MRVPHVEEAVTGGLHEGPARLAVDGQVDELLAGGQVVVPRVLGRRLVGPDEVASGGVARHLGGAVGVRVLVEARRGGGVAPVVGVPRRAVARAVIEQVGLGVEREPAPDGATARLPGVAVPGRGAGAVRRRVERLEVGADAHLLVGAHVVELPHLRARVEVVGGHVPADPALTAFDANYDVVARHERRHRRGLRQAEVGDLGRPDDGARVRVEREQLAVEGVEDDLAVGVHEPAAVRAAARLGLSQARHLRGERPLDVALLVEVERVQRVRLRGQDVHGRADDERGRFDLVGDADLERPGDLQVLNVVLGDLVERAVVPSRVRAVGHQPLPGVLLQDREIVVRLGEGQGERREHEAQGQGGPVEPSASCRLFSLA